jgi:tRNA(Ile)-lysidine synthetase-like protein
LVWPAAAIEAPDGVLLYLERLSDRPEAVRKEVLRKAIGACGCLDPSAEELEKLERLCRKSRPGHLELRAGVEAWRARDRVFLVRSGQKNWTGFPHFLRVRPAELLPDHRLRLGGGWFVACERATTRARRPAQQPSRDGLHVAWLQLAPQGERPTLRAWREGDRIRLFGSGGTAKVTDLLSRAQVPPPARRSWPVVLQHGEIAWIPGVARGEQCRIPRSGHGLLRLELIWPRNAPVWLAREADPGD